MAGFGASGREQPCGCMASVSCGKGEARVSSGGFLPAGLPSRPLSAWLRSGSPEADHRVHLRPQSLISRVGQRFSPATVS